MIAGFDWVQQTKDRWVLRVKDGRLVARVDRLAQHIWEWRITDRTLQSSEPTRWEAMKVVEQQIERIYG